VPCLVSLRDRKPFFPGFKCQAVAHRLPQEPEHRTTMRAEERAGHLADVAADEGFSA